MGLLVAGVVAWKAATAAPGVAVGFPQITALAPVFGGLAPWLAIPVMLFLMALPRAPAAREGGRRGRAGAADRGDVAARVGARCRAARPEGLR